MRCWGFEGANTHYLAECDDEPGWAWLQSRHGASLMLSEADPRRPGHEGVVFYLYCDDVAGMHAALRASGVAVGDITYPFCPNGEFRATDPDSYVCMVTHT